MSIKINPESMIDWAVSTGRLPATVQSRTDWRAKFKADPADALVTLSRKKATRAEVPMPLTFSKPAAPKPEPDYPAEWLSAAERAALTRPPATPAASAEPAPAATARLRRGADVALGNYVEEQDVTPAQVSSYVQQHPGASHETAVLALRKGGAALSAAPADDSSYDASWLTPRERAALAAARELQR